MKKVMIAVMALVFNTMMISCTAESIAETDELLNIQATEGDDEDVDPEREEGE